MSSNARKIPAEVLSHPAVVSLIDRARPTGRVTPEEVRQATEQAAVEPRHLKALLGHLMTLGISVDLGAPGVKAAAATSATKKTTTAKTAAKKPAAKKA
ncbi:RNA polymerase sigma factor, partial [Nocardioides sp. CER28]